MRRAQPGGLRAAALKGYATRLERYGEEGLRQQRQLAIAARILSRASKAAARRREVQCRGVDRFGSVRRGGKCRVSFSAPLDQLQKLPSFEESEMTYVCRSCGALGRWVDRELAQLKTRGLGERVRSWALFDTLLAERRADDPAWERHLANSRDRLRRARSEKTWPGGRGGDVHRDSILARTWLGHARRSQVEAAREVRLCKNCGLLLLIPTSPTARRTDFHWACWKEVIQSEEGRRWWRLMLKYRRSRGFSKEQVTERIGPPPVPKRVGRRRSSIELTRDFGWTVRHVLGGQSIPALAASSNPVVDRSVVSKAIRNTLGLLPEPAAVSRSFRPYVERLRARSAGTISRGEPTPPLSVTLTPPS